MKNSVYLSVLAIAVCLLANCGKRGYEGNSDRCSAEFLNDWMNLSGYTLAGVFVAMPAGLDQQAINEAKVRATQHVKENRNYIVKFGEKYKGVVCDAGMVNGTKGEYYLNADEMTAKSIKELDKVLQ